MPPIGFLGLLDAAIGALVGAGFFYVAWGVYYLVRKQHGLGFGDIALMGMAGAFLGVKLIVLVIALAPLATVVYVIALFIGEAFRVKPEDESAETPFLSRELPFGIFLGACSLVVVFAGNAIWRWYLGMFHLG